ncbi:hypothetical protein QAD02_004291 [Eretmocerus hayati]|uniref:Uncharacterized protein n=1 Tax=Eretmocerus hayati TaxID=131215 RepID=A0ACC2NP40_9HYME|nr:hypothetical protein QAD02_004291 [Eretmocerus hayati]
MFCVGTDADCYGGDPSDESCWEPCYCVLLQDEQTLTAYRSEDMALGDAMFVELPRVRLDGGSRAFRQYWGYESSRALAPPPPLIEEDEACIEPETVSLREANTASPIANIHIALEIIIGVVTSSITQGIYERRDDSQPQLLVVRPGGNKEEEQLVREEEEASSSQIQT